MGQTVSSNLLELLLKSEMMKRKRSQPYDVIIVGGGPAGLSAAKTAAKGGAKTLVLEEHREIGLPHHCSGWIWSCPYSEDLFQDPEYSKVVLRKLDSQCIYSPSGQMVIKIPMKGWVVDRVAFDRVLARVAAREGADIVLNSRVVSLLSEDNKVKGVSVETGGQTVNIESKIVIGAGGVKSIASGITKQANLAEPRNIFADVQIEYGGVKKLQSSSLEIYLGSFCGTEFGFAAPTGEDSMVLSMGSLKNYEIAREEYPPLKPMLKEAVPLSIFGGLSHVEGNRPFGKIVKDGLLIAGDAAGYLLVIRALISGSYAGMVAAKAVKEGDVSAGRLVEYDEKRSKGYLDAPDPLNVRELLRSRGLNIGNKPHSILKAHDAEIEQALVWMAQEIRKNPEPPALAKIEMVV